jgi:hypothetical protein
VRVDESASHEVLLFQHTFRDVEADGKQSPSRSPQNTYPYSEPVHHRWPPEQTQAHIFDAAFTRIILACGGHEVNPVIHWLIETCGDHFISWKFAILSGSIIILCLHSKFRTVKPVFYFTTVIYSVVVIYQMILISSF